MKKLIAVLFTLMFVSVCTSPAWAAGDKVRGEKGQGEVNQVDADSQGNQAD